jgi:hypothetical protein
MTVTALAAFGAMVVTAQAEYSGGAPFRNADQCFRDSARGMVLDGCEGWPVRLGFPSGAGEQEQGYSACASSGQLLIVSASAPNAPRRTL